MKTTNGISRRQFALYSVVASSGLLIGCASTSPTLQPPSKPAPVNAYLQITLDIKPDNRAAAAAVYAKYKHPFLDQIAGAHTKELLVREQDVQVLHGFSSEEQANAYLGSKLFSDDVVGGLKNLLEAPPEVRVYSVA